MCVFHEEFRRCFERSRGKKSSEETRFAQARGWARFTLALAKIVYVGEGDIVDGYERMY